MVLDLYKKCPPPFFFSLPKLILHILANKLPPPAFFNPSSNPPTPSPFSSWNQCRRGPWMAENTKTRWEPRKGGVRCPGELPDRRAGSTICCRRDRTAAAAGNIVPPGGGGGRRGEFWAARVVTGGDVCPQLRTGEVRNGLSPPRLERMLC